MHADDSALGTGIAVPADHGAGLDRDAGFHARWKNLLAIMPVLLFEQLPAWHAHDPPSNSLLLELFVSRNAKLHFAAAGNKDDIRSAILRPGQVTCQVTCQVIGHDI